MQDIALGIYHGQGERVCRDTEDGESARATDEDGSVDRADFRAGQRGRTVHDVVDG